MALSSDLISYWALDEASGNALDSHGSNDLTDNNSVGTNAGKVGNCRDFNGTNHAFTRADNADLSMGDIDFTFTMWVYLDATGSFYPLIYKDNSGFRDYSVVYTGSTFRLRLINASGTQTEVTTGSPSATTWYFLAARYDAAANEMSLSMNAGTPSTASHTGGAADSTAVFEMGRASAFNLFLNGRLDEVGIWKRKLSDAEITELYNSGSGRDYAYITGGGGGGAASRLTKYAQNIPHMHGNNRFIRIGR